jgi:hypothetical protein
MSEMLENWGKKYVILLDLGGCFGGYEQKETTGPRISDQAP